MNELALFAGAGGGILGGKLLGWRTVCAVELNPYRRAVLMQRQCDGMLEPFPIWDDVRTFDGVPWSGLVDVVSGGFPCQAFSGAARGTHTAQNLWPEMRRVVADVAPRYVLAENVSEKAISVAGDELEEMGYSVRATAVAASDLGADHIRKRYWLLAYADCDRQLRMQKHDEMAELPSLCRSIWKTGPDEPRMANGVAHRVERLAATGDGQIPAMVAVAWKTLIQNAELSDARNERSLK